MMDWTEVSDGYYKNMNVPVPANVDWRVFADVLCGASNMSINVVDLRNGCDGIGVKTINNQLSIFKQVQSYTFSFEH